MLPCESIFGRTTINSFQEFYFAMAVAAECGRRGEMLDMSKMRVIDQNLLSKNDKAYLKYLKETGAIYDGTPAVRSFTRGSEDDIESERPAYWFDVNAISELYGTLFREEESGYHWSYDWAANTYDSRYLKTVTSKILLGNTLMHIVAHMIVCFIVGDREEKPIMLHFNSMEVRSTYVYLCLYAVCMSCENIGRLIKFDFEEKRRELRDLEFFILYESSRNSGLFSPHTTGEKLEAMRLHGIQEGSIVAIYRRARISDTNPAGCIKEAYIARIERMPKPQVPSFVVSSMSVNKTLEEVELDYLSIDENYRGMFADMLEKKMAQHIESRSLYTTGVCEYFYDEEWLLCPLDKSETVTKRVTIDGRVSNIEMDTVDAVYWILNEYGVPFDRDLYKAAYNEGRDLLWDRVDGTPCLETDKSSVSDVF